MFQEIPSDILIRICSYLDLSHVLSFVSVCSSLRQLADSRYLWIDVLERTRKTRYLACPTGADLSQMTIGMLRSVARRTIKLERNWSMERPRIARSVRTIQYSDTTNEEPAVILAAISATSFVILYLRAQRQILICDSQGQMPLQRIHVGEIRLCARFDDFGNHLIAVLTQDWDEVLLKVISIDHELGVRELLSTTPPSRSYLDGCLFVTPGSVGLLCQTEDGMISIHMINFMQKSSVEVPIVPANLANARSISLSIVDGRLFIIITSNNDDTSHQMHDIYRCPVNKLSLGEDHSWTGTAPENGLDIELVAQLAISDLSGSFDREIIEFKLSQFGFRNLHVVYPEAFAGLTYATFWSPEQIFTRTTSSVEYGKTIEIEGQVGSHYDHSAPWLMASSHSGLYSILVMQHADEGPQLRLLHWDSDTPAIHARTLDVPRYIDLTEIYSVAIEETYGVVYLCHAQGYLFALPYA